MAKKAGKTDTAAKQSGRRKNKQEQSWQNEEKAEALLQRVKETKLVTFGELEALSLPAAQMEALRKRLGQEHIIIVDTEDEEEPEDSEILAESDGTDSGENDTLTEDGVRQYLKEISRVKLLTAEEEWALAEKIKAGDTEALFQLVEANLRLVVSVARRYSGRGVHLLDLIQEGNKGLIEAAQKYDPNHKRKKSGSEEKANGKLRFSTCATLYIKRNIKRELNGSRMIYLPENKVEFLRRSNVFEAKIRMEYNRAPTEEEFIQNEMDLHALRELERDRMKTCGRAPTEEEIAAKRKAVAQLVRERPELLADITSYNATIGDDDSDTELIDSIPDLKDVFDNPNEKYRDLYECLEDLPTQERLVLIAFFWTKGDEQENLSAIGKKYGMSSQQARKLRDSALKRLQQPEYLRDLKKLRRLLENRD